MTRLKKKENEIFLSEDSVSNLQHENSTASEAIEKRSRKVLKKGLKRTTIKSNRFSTTVQSFNQKIRTLVKDSKFYEENETCPSCSQDISADLREEKTFHRQS